MRTPSLIQAALHFGQRFLACIPLHAEFQCNICNQRVRRFLPYRNGVKGVTPFVQQLAVVGSDVENFECPACSCHDRERHLLMYMQASGVLQKFSGAKILHLAPERHLQRFIRDAKPCDYILGDLYPDRPEIKKINLQNMPFAVGCFDFVIANHVLEHVHDDLKALSEIHRVLRKGGYAILQTPYSSVLKNIFEDEGINTDVARLHAYGQEDHRRLYGVDIFQRIESSGFSPHVKNHSEIFYESNSGKHGVNEKEPFFLFQKK